jgi:AcrR family transcriptional regulator
MKTREKILATSLDLFNQYGISNVSSKHVSEVMGISYGNLCYHFPKKDDIILQLYLDMQEKLDQQFEQVQRDIFNFEFMLAGLKDLFNILYEYKFIYLGITKVIRHFETIKKHAQEQNQVRGKTLNTIGTFLVEQGYLKPFESKEHKDMLIHALLMVINSWISDAEVFFQKEENKIEYYVKLFFNMVKPLLTESGLEKYELIYAYFEEMKIATK